MPARRIDNETAADRAARRGWQVTDDPKELTGRNTAGTMFTIRKPRKNEAGKNMPEQLNFQDETAPRKTAAKRAAAVNNAAGPYLVDVEDVKIMWFAEQHPAPWMRWVYITPEIADYLLNSHNLTNRPINDRQVEHYRRIILSGQWHLTHQGAAMDVDGALQDGQHRLKAVAEAGADDPSLKIPFAFFVGMPRENFAAIDEGLLRTAAQLFTRGGEKNGSIIQSSIRMVSAFRSDNARGMLRLKLPNEQILAIFAEDPEELRTAAAWGGAKRLKTFTSAPALAGAHYLIRRANGPENKYVAAFLEGLATGRKAGTRIQLDDDDPRAVYVETVQNAKLRGKRIPGLDQLAMIVLSWNNLVTNTHPRYLRFPDDAPMPRVLICQDTGPKASAVPTALLGELEPYDED